MGKNLDQGYYRYDFTPDEIQDLRRIEYYKDMWERHLRSTVGQLSVRARSKIKENAILAELDPDTKQCVMCHHIVHKTVTLSYISIMTNPMDQLSCMCDNFPDDSSKYYKGIVELVHKTEKAILNNLRDMSIVERQKYLFLCLSCATKLDKMTMTEFDYAMQDIVMHTEKVLN